MQGKFVTFEGIEGAGKSTVIQAVHEFLLSKNIACISTREPGGTEIGEDIRNILLKNRKSFSHEAELFLIMAARAQHIQQIIIPAIQQGTWVLCDRFIDSTIAYQGAGRGMDISQIEYSYNMISKNLKINKTIILDVTEDIGIMRARKKGVADRFEKEEYNFFFRVRQKYKELAQTHDRYVCIDATAPPQEVITKTLCQIQTLL